MITRRTALAALAASQLAGRAARAQSEWPDRPIRLIVPFGAGGPVDMPNRLVAERIRTALNNQPVVLDFRPGAGGNIGAEAVVRSAPDGTTIGFIATSHAVNPSLYRNLTYDVLRDFAPIGLVFSVPVVLLVHAAVPARTLAEFTAWLRTRPGQVNYGSPGAGSSAHLLAEIFARETGTAMVHVPYRGGAPAMNDLLAGQIQAMFELATSAVPQARGGALRALAVSTTQRLVALPEVPTFAEAGLPGFDHRGWGGWMAPAGTPEPILARLAAGLDEALADAAVAERLASVAAEPGTLRRESFGRFVAAETAKFAAIIRERNIVLE